MSQPQLLKTVTAFLDEIEVAYMVTGSLASSLFGEPRLTHDIDLVIKLTASNTKAVQSLLTRFPEPDFYLEEDAIGAALRNVGMFNLIDTLTGDKVGFWTLTSVAFDQQRFQRRVYKEFDGNRICFCTPEDSILMKLKWGRESGGSAKQVQDALRVLEVQHDRLDVSYLDRWAAELGLTSDLMQLRAAANL